MGDFKIGAGAIIGKVTTELTVYRVKAIDGLHAVVGYEFYGFHREGFIHATQEIGATSFGDHRRFW